MRRAAAAGFAGVRLTNVAAQVGLDFRQGAFRFGVTPDDTPAMMGGGLCWLDYNNDGWLDLFVVNSYADSDLGTWDKHGGLPTSALFRQRPRQVRERHRLARAPASPSAARAASPPT